MRTQRPHYLLHTQTSLAGARGNWNFTLRGTTCGSNLEVFETEELASRERLELLAVVRGLESVPRPARVTLVTDSQYVRQGIRHGLEEWRANQWHWEAFGELVPIKNLDLWRRVDRALQCHQVEFKYWRIDAAHGECANQVAVATTTVPLSTVQQSPSIPRGEFAAQSEPTLPTLGRCRTAQSRPNPTELDEFAEYEAGYQIWQPADCEEECFAPRRRKHRRSENQYPQNGQPDSLAHLANKVSKRRAVANWRLVCPNAWRRAAWLTGARALRRIHELSDSLAWFLRNCGVRQVLEDICGLPQHPFKQYR